MDEEDEGEFTIELTAFCTPGNMPGLNKGFSVVPGGPRIDCIAWKARLGLPEADDEDPGDELPAEP